MDPRYEREWELRMNPRFRGKGRGAKKRAFQGGRSEDTEDSNMRTHQGGNDRDGTERPRRPPGLRGREIGLWYAQQNRGKREHTEGRGKREHADSWWKREHTARNEESKNRTFITMDRFQEHHISDPFRSIQSPDIAGQNLRSYRLPSPAGDDRVDNDDGGGWKRNGDKEEDWFCSDQVGKPGPEVDQTRSNEAGSRPRPPPGLRGREIGLWHSQQRRQEKGERRARNEESKNRAYITMDSYQERRISDLLQSIQSPEVAGQNPRSYRLPSPIDDFRDDNDDEDEKSDDDNEEEWFCSDPAGKPGPEVDQTRSNEAGSGSATSSCLDSVHTNPTCVRLQEVGPMCSMNYVDHWDMSYQREGNRSSETSLKSSVEKSEDFKVLIPKSETDLISTNVDIKSASEKKVDEDNDDDEEFDNDFDDAVETKDASNCKEEDFGEQRYIEEDSREEEEDVSSPINFKCEAEEEDSNFMFDFYKNAKGNVAESPKRRDYHSLARDKDLDKMLIDQQRSKESNGRYQQMLEFRQKLPCCAKRQEILDAINSNQVVVISGETGCGKTTQVTQFILDSWIEKGDGSLCRVVCTQPRRISAISIAERVTDERVEPLGTSVGYQIRLEQKMPRDQGSILYCTTGIMLKWLESDPWLAATSHIILDEVHERDILCDFLMVILRDLIRQRRDLKLILMSATLNANMFSEYFGNCPMIHIPGYTFPVKEFFLEDIIEMIHFAPNKAQRRKPNFRLRGKNAKEERQKMDEYQEWISHLDCRKYSRTTTDVLRSLICDSIDIDYDLVTALIHHVVLKRPDGAILVFVPGWEQIRKVMDSLNAQPIFTSKNFRIIPLHSLMPTVNQREVFERPPPGQRKIVIATNIAETSITIDDVVYVIDCGTMKMKKFDVTLNLSTLQPEWISRANEKQRRGRAGRVCAGECFHLYTTFQECRLDDFLQPEMLRTRLEELCLQIKLLKLGRIKEFVSKAMQPPSMDSLDLAIRLLRDLNALTADEELTPLGFHLAKMPVDPHSGKMLLFAALFSCLDPILTVAASLSFKDAFYVPMGHEKTADERKRQLSNKTKSDHLLLANAYVGWERAKEDRNVYNYCRYNYLSTSTLQMLQSMRRQFAQLLFDMGFTVSADPKSSDSNQNSGNVNLVKSIVCAGLYPNVARLKPIQNIHSKRPLLLYTKSEQKVHVHPKSVVFAEREFSSQWFVYHLKMKTTKIYLYDCSPVSPYSLLFFGGDITYRKDLGQNCIIVDDWIKFGATRRVASLVQELRREFDLLMERKITNPCATNWYRRTQEGALMRAILDLLVTDDSPSKHLNRSN